MREWLNFQYFGTEEVCVFFINNQFSQPPNFNTAKYTRNYIKRIQDYKIYLRYKIIIILN